MEVLLLNEYLFLISMNQTSSRDPFSQLHFQFLPFSLVLQHQQLFVIGHIPSLVSGLLENVISRCVLMISHLDDNLESPLVEDLLHIGDLFLVTMSL